MEAKTEYLTIKEIATKFRVNPVTIQRLIYNGELEALKVGGSYRIPTENLEKFIKASTGVTIAKTKK
jgi:excisionase family DNA binding protein